MSTNTRSCFCGGCSSCMIWRGNDEIADLKAKLSAALLQIEGLQKKIEDNKATDLAIINTQTKALRDEVERLQYFERNVEQNEKAYNESQEEVRRLNRLIEVVRKNDRLEDLCDCTAKDLGGPHLNGCIVKCILGKTVKRLPEQQKKCPKCGEVIDCFGCICQAIG